MVRKIDFLNENRLNQQYKYNMSSFTTFNQFDKRFTIFDKFSGDRTACPLFSLITCYNFMQDGDISQKKHENNIYASVTNYTTKNLPKYMLFDELLQLSNGSINVNNIGATSPELITAGILGYEHIFKFGYEQNYCLIFLKNRNYISILVKNDTYAVRDCHENNQHTFNNFDTLRNFLNNTYQFEQITCVDGVLLPEFSNIEFLVIDAPFEIINVDPNLIDETIEEDKTFETPTIIDQPTSFPNMKITDVDYEMALSLLMEDQENCEYAAYI
jgi:hypothetical protein